MKAIKKPFLQVCDLSPKLAIISNFNWETCKNAWNYLASNDLRE